MKFSLRFLIAGVFLLGAGVHAQSPNAASPQILVSGPAGVVTALDVEASVQQFPINERLARLSRPEEVRRIAEEIYLRRAFAKKSEQSGLDKAPLTQALLQVTRERILSDAELFEVGKAGWPADATLLQAARELYQSNPKRFETGALTGARQIQLSKGATEADRTAARERAEAIRKEAAASTDFAAVARRYSIDPSTASLGGEMGFFAKGTMLPEIEAALEKLTTPGQVSEVIESPAGFHILRLEGRRPAGIRPFDEVSGLLVQELRAQADQQAKARAIGQVRAEMQVQGSPIEALAKRFATAKGD